MTPEDAWRQVHAEAERLRPVHLRALFAADPDRFASLSFRLDDLLIDVSKEKLDARALAALLALARAVRLEGSRDAMFAGAPVNLTERRAALHMALRGGAGERVVVDGEDVMPAVNATLARFLAFAEDVRAGRCTGAAGAPYSDVVHIGIGGSVLGPEMATRALAPWHDGPRLHYVANVDGADLADTVRHLDPARTLVIVASKTFTTLETMTNARSARGWLEAALGERAGLHLAAVSTNRAATRAFGIDESRVFGFWGWVGGRYSVWSAIGLPIAIAIGGANFRAFLAGARSLDAHFRDAPLEHNLPVVLALVSVWRRNAMGWPTVALVPYEERLARFPAYIQQLAMESNGKRVTLDGAPVPTATAPVLWGEPGTNSQHSFFQLIHQGTDTVPVDFLVAAQPADERPEHHAKLTANALAQSAALAFGRGEREVRAEMATAGTRPEEIDRLAPHRSFPGDRPSTTILYRTLDPATLGRLIALYEHRTFAESVIWNINAFDQWGVELGKQLATRFLPAVSGEAEAELDPSTAGLLAHYRALRDAGGE
ncbi:MAG TPA: glucose-6-phosphate isomerase [Thermohalobaculum sp.]|nr:glucose-6-phosphate isomerase [Thermohalobaculum sp.]